VKGSQIDAKAILSAPVQTKTASPRQQLRKVYLQKHLRDENDASSTTEKNGWDSSQAKKWQRDDLPPLNRKEIRRIHKNRKSQ
jgi:hypothetical protein